MLRPSQVQFYAKKAENKNYRFRSWLKMHADPDDLDAQFLRLHKELFSGYDCSRCRNCCKHYCGTIPAEDVERDAKHLHMSADAFVEKYLDSRLTRKPAAIIRSTSPVISWMIRGIVFLGTVFRETAWTIHIQTSRTEWKVCFLFWRRLLYARLLMRSVKD